MNADINSNCFLPLLIIHPFIEIHIQVHIMGRWAQYTEDSERLPTGMKRIGYDADTQRYTFRDEKGVLYESEPGNVYGTLRPVVRDDIRRTRPNAFESSRKPSHSRSSSTPPTTNLRSFQDFLPPTAITTPPNPHTRTHSSSSSSSSSDSRLPDVFSKVKSMTSFVSRLQFSNKPREGGSGGGRYQHIKSSSLPISSLSHFERSSPQPPPVPSRRSRDYNPSSRKGVEGDDMRKGLLRSKTSVTRSSAITSPPLPPSSSSSTPGSRYRSSIHRSTSISPSSSGSSYPKRTSSQASRISSISTTSTITPMKTT